MLPFPLLKDEDIKHVSAFGILNEDYSPGHKGYGIPHPGILYLDSERMIRAKFAAEGYKKRPPMQDIYAEVQALISKGMAQER